MTGAGPTLASAWSTPDSAPPLASAPALPGSAPPLPPRPWVRPAPGSTPPGLGSAPDSDPPLDPASAGLGPQQCPAPGALPEPSPARMRTVPAGLALGSTVFTSFPAHTWVFSAEVPFWAWAPGEVVVGQVSPAKCQACSAAGHPKGT